MRLLERLAQVRRPRGPKNLARGRRLGYCAHWDCAGERSVWSYRGVAVCARHWRQRKRLYSIDQAVNERKAS